MKRKRLLSIGLVVLMTATMPSTTWAFEEVEIEAQDTELSDEQQDEDVALYDEIELDDDDTQLEDVENENTQNIDVQSEDVDLFTSDENDVENVGEEEIVPEVRSYVDYTSINGSKTLVRGIDNTLNLKCKVSSNLSNIQTVEKFVVKADIYIDDNKINESPVILTKSTKAQATGTYILESKVLDEYPKGGNLTIKYYSDFDIDAVKVMFKKTFAIPALSNPEVIEIQGTKGFKYERGKECCGDISVKLSGNVALGKEACYAVYINGERKTAPVALDKAKYGSDIKNRYVKSNIIIDPGLTEYLPEGSTIEIKVGFGPEMENVSDKVLLIEVTGKVFLQGAKVDEVSVYKDASQEKSLNWVRAGRTYTVYVTGKFRDVVETDPLEVYAGAYVSGTLVGELQKLTVEADNSAYNGTITFTLPDDTPSNPLVADAVRIKVGIGSEMNNGRSEAIRSGSKLDPNEIKVKDLKVLDGFMEEEVKYIDRQNAQSCINVTMTLEGLPDDLIGTHHEEWLGNQMIDSGLGSPEGMLVGIGEDKAKLLKDYEGKSFTLKIVSDIDDEAIFTYEMPLVGLTTKEEETANTVADQLKALPAVDKIALEDKESVKAARDAYDALNEDQKKLVPEEQVKALTDAETKIAELQKAADKKATDEKAAKAVTDQIAAIPAVKALKLTDASKVKAARDAYNKLSADQKKLVTAAQLKALTDAEARIAQLQKAAQVKPKITLNVTSLPIQVKKSTAGIRIKTTAIKGDKIKSAKSSKSKVAKVSVKNGKLTIKGLKAGKATVTVTSTKGAKATVKITVQKQKVATKKLSATVSTKQTLKKGKRVTLKVAKTPFTAQDTVKWTSSNKKVATVTSKGVVKGLKKGTATITAKAGKKVVKFKVTVK